MHQRHLPLPMALNEQQNIVFLNRAFIETFGYELLDIPTLEHWWKAAYPNEGYRKEVMMQWFENLEFARTHKTPFSAVEIVIRCKNGDAKTALVFSHF
jgi:PAS domain-containing protein